MSERREHRIDGGPAEGEKAARISLKRLDAFILGDLPAAEAEAIRRELERDPAARAYVERQAALRSRGSFADLEARIRERARPSLPARVWAAFRPRRSPSAGDRRGGPRLKMFGGTAAAFAGLLLGAALWIGRWDPAGSADDGGMRPKGGSRPEIALRHRGTEFAPGALIPARSGDTLVLAYRSADSLRVQVWYQEDGGSPAAMTGPGGFALPPATAWTEARQRIRLEGAWKRQQVWILLSRGVLDPERAAQAVRRGPGAGRGEGGVEVAAYRLAAPEE